MDNGGARLLGKRFRQESDQPFHLGHIVGFGIAILAGPARDLPLEIIAGLAEIGEVGRHRIDIVKVGERIDQLIVHAAARRGVEVRQSAVGVRTALRKLHHVEDGTDDGRIVTQCQWLGHREIERFECREQPIFAIDRMR
jgi:hypothetical protein